MALRAVGGTAHVGDGHGHGGGHGEFLSMDVDELVAQRAAGLVQPRLDRAGARAEAPGHLGVAEPAEVKERHGRALAGGQRRDRRADALGDLGGLGRLVGPGPGRRRVGGVRARPARALLQRAPAQVQPDPDQPRPEALGVAQPVQADEGGHDRLLRGVGGQLAVAGRPAAGGEQDAVVALDEQRERATVAAAGGGHRGRHRVCRDGS